MWDPHLLVRIMVVALWKGILMNLTLSLVAKLRRIATNNRRTLLLVRVVVRIINQTVDLLVGISTNKIAIEGALLWVWIASNNRALLLRQLTWCGQGP